VVVGSSVANLVRKSPVVNCQGMPGRPHAGISVQGHGYYNVNLPPMLLRRVSTLQLARHSEDICETWATIEPATGDKGENYAR